jgi:glutaredoxin 3
MTQIKVYSTPVCPWCRMLKDDLREKKVEFTEIDVSTDAKAAKEMVDKSCQMGVPQIEINGKMIVGFDKEAIDEELSKITK